MSLVWSTEGIGRSIMKLLVNSSEIALWQNHIRVEDYQVLAASTLRTIVAALTRAAVLLHEIPYVELGSMAVAHVLTGFVTAVFDDDNLKILEALSLKTLQQLINLIGTVVYRHNNGIFHTIRFSSAKIVQTNGI